LLWILALAKARSAAPISTAISAKRATQASAKIDGTLEGARQKGSWLRRSFVPAHCGDAPPSLLAIRPSASTRDPLQCFNSLLGSLVDRNDFFPHRFAYIFAQRPIEPIIFELLEDLRTPARAARHGKNRREQIRRDA
jgi:hypothetical protein